MKYMRIELTYDKHIYVPAAYVSKMLDLMDKCSIVHTISRYDPRPNEYERYELSYPATLEMKMVEGVPCAHVGSEEEARSALEAWVEARKAEEVERE
jgi:hypothetical protein